MASFIFSSQVFLAKFLPKKIFSPRARSPGFNTTWSSSSQLRFWTKLFFDKTQVLGIAPVVSLSHKVVKNDLSPEINKDSKEDICGRLNFANFNTSSECSTRAA